ncbi:helix-turn-helix transcriptional regulator [Streptomyces sp. NPDC003077]|uniref:helix-turn-helix domain-containing protein n=1 Tax=Streptomyces sp. NPDC003077 TaxID=3154443 RepID=UPI0033B70AD5
MDLENDEAASAVVTVFGGQLKMCREFAGLSREELGKLLGYAMHTIKAYELATRIPEEATVLKADEVLSARGMLSAWVPVLAEVRFSPFVRPLARYEAHCVSRYSYDPLAVPGLLQTEEYARAVVGAAVPAITEGEVERGVGERLARQEVLDRESPPTVNFVIEQSALERPIGGSRTHRAQLEQVLRRGEQRSLSIQVMPTGVKEHPGIDGGMILLEMPERRKVGYIESQANRQLVTDRKAVSRLMLRYDMIRTQALPTSESAEIIEKLAGQV